jgi:hypothetical protein
MGNTGYSAAKQSQMLDDLRNLLEKQIELAHKGNISGAELLGRQADPLVETIVQAGILQLPEFENRRQRLQRLYEDLRLTIATQKADTAAKLRRVRKGKRTLETYLSNI